MLSPEESAVVENHLAATVAAGRQRLTTNCYGWEHLFLDDVTVDFIRAVKALPGQPKIADLGVAFGYSTEQLLTQTSALVTANDLSADHLSALVERLPEALRERLQTLPGNALELDFPENSLDGILALRWMQCLRPAEIQTAFGKFSKWLKPGGLLCLTAPSPFMLAAQPKFLAIYEERVRNGEAWPGRMDADTLCWIRSAVAIDHGYLLDEMVLRRECLAAGLEVIRCNYFAHTLSERENIGLMAVKK
ncbi:hypothetical protein BV898_04642 [Hypsibius exemplaris]|uniref:Methyltransferase domain-containing protein n=1 Tax=Hypsibius exemplaris TaxID=2072580 RepID=A0A1W0X1S3_HYPEX|nr:hypothetical protein BV898_04642 [Hypsibius exemplaris]